MVVNDESGRTHDLMVAASGGRASAKSLIRVPGIAVIVGAASHGVSHRQGVGMNGRAARKTTAGISVAGAVVALVANGLAPRISGNDVDVYHRIAHSDRFAAAGVLVLLAVTLVVAAFTGLTRSGVWSNNTSALEYARLATASGGAIALAQVGIQLYGYRQQARAFDGADAHNVVSAFWATNALDHASSGLMAMWTITLLGIAPVLLGLAQMREMSGARLPFLAVLGGTICVFVGIAELLKSDQSTFDIPFAIGSVLVTLWLLATGIGLWRRSSGADKDLTHGRATAAATTS